MKVFRQILGGLVVLLISQAPALTVTEVSGSNDHRIFRAGELTRILLEPIRWKLVDTYEIRMNARVTDVMKTLLPPEYAAYTLDDLLSGGTPLPDSFPRAEGETAKEALMRGLWNTRTRVNLKFDEPRHSAVAVALFWTAVSEKTGLSLEVLCQRYLCEPYGLVDTSFSVRPNRRSELVCENDASDHDLPWLLTIGLLSSPHDILRVAYVVQPLLDRVQGGLSKDTLLCGHKLAYVMGTDETSVFLGFDREAKSILLWLSTDDEPDFSELLSVLDSLQAPL